MVSKVKKALVTGAGRGIGRACAIALADCGMAVALVSRDGEQLEDVSKHIQKANGQSISIPFDLCDQSRLEELHDQVKTKLGDIDVLVNGAGIYKTETVDNLETSNWEKTFSTNLTAPYKLSVLLAKHMKEQNWGRIINISSISGVKAEAFGASYSASKFGLIGLTQSLALELAKYGVTVNAVCPGWVDTKMAREQLHDDSWCKLNDIDVDQSLEIAKLSVPQERLLEPSEIGSLVSYLASHQARGITGQAINICGGLSIT